MRAAFIKSLEKAAAKNKKIFLLSGDLGYGAVEPFMRSFPDRFLNMGVSEQHMVGFAAGLALSGKIPIVYSIATFATLRCYEQIRNDICYQNINAKIVGVGSGLSYSQYGATHNAMEDISIMRSLPNMTVLCPGDPVEVSGAVKFMLTHPGPYYLRIGGRGEPNIHQKQITLKTGKGIVVREGSRVACFTTGNTLEVTMKAAALLEKKEIQCRVISMPFIKPIDEKLIIETIRSCDYIFAVEEHSKIGGLGSAISEIIAENIFKKHFYFKRIAGPDAFQNVGGWLSYVRDTNNLSPEKIAQIILTTYRTKHAHR